MRAPTPHATAFLLFLAFYGLMIIDARHKGWRDPGSIFFNPDIAFEREYSLLREAQALSYIKSASESAEYLNHTKAGLDPTFCIGITTLQREGARYFQRNVGSLLAGLSEAERQDFWLEPFIVNMDPEEHLAYHEPWLEAVSDHVLTYADAKPEVKARVEVFRPDDFRKKALFDYAYLLRTCYERNVPWVIMVEDDTIAADGWFYRTRRAVAELTKRSDYMDMLYLRLFYNERLLGWNSEEWFSYVVWSLFIEALVISAIVAALKYGPKETRQILTPLTSITIVAICTPMLLGLYFAAGRLTVSPLRRGLNKMPTYGCCSQAFAFPSHVIPEMLEYYNSKVFEGGYVDVLTEIYGRQHKLDRWALTPSVFNHVGGKSSKGEQTGLWGRKNTENIWNFSFETFDEKDLESEHFG